MKKKGIEVLLGCGIVFLLINLLGCQVEPQMYSVAFDTDGGSTVTTQSVQENGKATRPDTDPIKSGYAFDNWYTEATLDNVWNFDTVITKDTTVYASWAADTYTVTFDANEATAGTVPTEQSKIHGVDLTLASNYGNLSRTGYSYAGWDTQADGLGTGYTEESSYTADAEVTLYAKWIVPVVGGRGPSGGYIFYDDEVGFDFNNDSTIGSDEKDLLDGTNDGTISGDRYLEAAPSDIMLGADDYTHIFGYYRTTENGSPTLVGATATGIGTGVANTTALVGAMGSTVYTSSVSSTTTTTEDYAARLCDLHEAGGYSDWFLPSKDELDLMYVNLKENNQGDLFGYPYWSSSEDDAGDACNQAFNDGFQTVSMRRNTHRVRPVRAF